MKNRAGLLALVVLVIASLLMVFFVLPRINHETKPIGEAINAAGSAVKNAVSENREPEKATEDNKPAETASAPTTPPPAEQPAPSAVQNTTTPKTAKPAQPQAVDVTPAFDVLRVEPDGSTVIAGRATPHSTLEVIDGSDVTAKTDVGPSGDFVAILETPLPPGDHQLQLKATAKDGKVIISEETATVSVPEDRKSGKLLALVTTPGKASRVIAMPQQDVAKAVDKVGEPAAPAAPATGAQPQAAAATKPAATESQPVTAVVPQGSSTITAAPPAIGKADLQVTAVELEGSKIFIAGTTKGGLTVRGFADAKQVGQSRSGGDGHFVIEGNASLTVGDHRIAVEALNAAGQSLMRVEVPFNRPAGEQVAAVAAPAANSSTANVDGGAFDRLRNEVVRAFNLLQGLYADGKLPNMEQLAAARSATSISLKSLSEYRLPADASVSARSLADNAAKDAAAAAASLDKVANDVAAVGTALKDLGDLIAKAVGPAIAQQIDGRGADAGQSPDTANNEATSEAGPTTIQQAPLTQSARSSVIIRQGDTLWQISRRVYGQGVRYTTIYLANEDQIRNPDIIQPGQIFGVPEDYRPDSEELHRERMMHKKG